MIEGIIKLLEFFEISPHDAPRYILFGGVLIGSFYWILKQKLKPLNDLSKSMERFIIRLCGAIESGGDISKIQLYRKGSPLELTEKGKDELKNIGFIDDINNNLGNLFKKIDELKPNSALDVERLSVGIVNYYIIDNANENIFKKTEDYIYNNPECNNAEYFKAAGLYLRDKYLEKHSELIPKIEN